MKIFYFETSAINYLWQKFDDNNIKFLRDVLTYDGSVLSLSPISMWEIVSTPDATIRDDLIHVCQLLFDEERLFPSPTKILDVFMERGCKLEFSMDGFWETDCWISKIWRDIAADEAKTIIVDGIIFSDDKQNMTRVKKVLLNLIKNNFERIPNPPDEYYIPACDLINTIFSQVNFIQEYAKQGLLDKEKSCFYKTSIFFAVCILILGILTDREERLAFWHKRGISDDINEQVCYLFHQNATILHRGPLVYMAAMAIAEAKGTNRGLYKDCLHAVYMPYCTTFFTHDKHFIEMANHDIEGLWKRITDIEKFCDDIHNITQILNEQDVSQ